jgi:methylase of polypeptide subunit release factors
MPIERADPKRLATLSDAHVHALRDALARHGFDGEMLGECESWAPKQFDAVRMPLVHHELRRRDDAAAAIARLFAYDDAVPRDRVDELLGAEVVRALLGVDALFERDGGVASRLRIVPFDTLWIASDDWARVTDPVMGPGPTTLELAAALDTAGVDSLLDVGCGAGSLALLAKARGVAHVVGVDIDARALDYSRFNARLNRLECEWLAGDLGAPVRGRRFDAVVSQPAYVARPDTVGDTTYLHGGARGDELALRLLGELPGLLGEGARAWVLFDTPSASGKELVARVRDALVEPALDTIIAAPQGMAAREYAVAYATLVDPDLGAAYRAAVEQYARHFQTLGIVSLRHVLVHVARAQGDRAGSMLLEPTMLRGIDRELLARVRAGMRVVARGDAALLGAAIVPAPEAWLVYEEALGGEPRTRSRVQLGRGLDQSLSDTAAVLLQSLRDHQPLRDAIAAYAEAIDAPPQEVVGSALDFVRRGLASGLLVSP